MMLNMRFSHSHVNPHCALFAIPSHSKNVHKTHMDKDDIAKWVRDSLARAGKSQASLAALLNLETTQGNRIANGTRPLKAHEMFLVADFLGVSPPGLATSVPLVGRVGAGAVHFIDGVGPLGEVEAPPNVTPKTVAVEVSGDSEIGNNAPNGSLIYYDDVRDPPDETLLDRLCVLWTGDGRALLKRLIAREPTGLWTIQASNGSYERGVEVVAAARVKFIAPR